MILLHCLISGRTSEHAGGRDHRKASGGEVENIRTGTETQHQSVLQLNAMLQLLKDTDQPKRLVKGAQA
jgi:hypothetical protein